VNDRGQRRRGPNAERDHRQCARRESPARPQAADRVSKVLRNVLEHASSPLVPHPFLGPLHATEAAERLTTRALRLPTFRHQLARLQLDVEAKLLVELALDARGVGEQPRPAQKPAQPARHHAFAPPHACSTWATAAE
jgi:hypothetical protein